MFSGFTGRICETKTEECSSLTCLHNGICRKQEDGLTCLCPQGTFGGSFDSEVFNVSLFIIDINEGEIRMYLQVRSKFSL